VHASIVSAILAQFDAQFDAQFVGWRTPLLIGIFGLPGSGKTAVTHWLAARYPLIALSTDTMRLRYELPSGPATIDVMYKVAATLLPRRTGIIFDGIHMRQSDRARLQAFAASHSAHSALLYITADSGVIDERIATRQDNPEQTRAEGKFVITRQHFERIASWLEVPAGEEAVWQIDTTDDQIGKLLAGLTTWLGQYVETDS